MVAMKSVDPETFLLGCFDFERERLSRRLNKPFTLERVQKALELLKRPEKQLQVIHIAGTKGKGSTLELIYQGLNISGFKNIGLFTSPHYVSLCERIRIDHQCIPIAKFESFSLQVMELNRESFNGELSFFECLFLIAMLYFKSKNIQIAILETGLGGRLDATNSIPTFLSVITRIDYDHEEILGYTLPEIAKEKAGIIRNYGEVIALNQSDVVNRVFAQVCDQKKANLQWVNIPKNQPQYVQSRWENAHIAQAVVNRLLPKNYLDMDDLLNCPLIGRLECVEVGGQKFLLDGAHNRISLKNLNSFISQKPEKIQCAFAMSESRQAIDLLRELDSKVIQSMTFFELPSGRPGVKPEELNYTWNHLESRCLSKVGQSLKAWIESPYEGIKLATGSIYLVGEVMSCLNLHKTSN